MQHTIYQHILRDRVETFDTAARRSTISDEYRDRLRAQARAARKIDEALSVADLPKDAIASLLQLVQTADLAAQLHPHAAWPIFERACYVEALDVLSHPDAPTTIGDNRPPSPPSPLRHIDA